MSVNDPIPNLLLDAVARSCVPLGMRLYSAPQWEVGSVLRLMLDSGRKLYTVRVDLDYAPIVNDATLLMWIRQVVDLEALYARS